jgi:glyoxylase-like metal-dependent hydrolase (beta-lactamase superfamily II)
MKTIPGRHWAVVVMAAGAMLAAMVTGPAQAQPGKGKGKAGGPPAAAAPAAPPKGPAEPNLGNVEIHTLKVQGNVYMLVGAGGNMAVQVGPMGVLVVDAQYAQLSDKIIAAIGKLSDKPVRYVINTSFDLDHVGGNYNLNRAGAPVIGGNLGAAALQRGAAIVAHENVLNRMSAPAGQTPPYPEGWWPYVTYFEGQKEIYFNGEAVIVMHHEGHTDGDSIVHFRGSDVVATGDIFNTLTYPVINLNAGGNINGVIEALNHVLDIAIPAHEQEGGTMIIPGHGRLCDEHDVLEYRDMVTIVRDRVQAMIKRGMTLEQVQAANPTKDYDPRYGATAGPWTTAMFVEAVYKSLKK